MREKTMVKAIVIRETGGPEQMSYEDIDLAAPGPGEARIRHGAIGLNFIDVYFRTGLYKAPSFPFTPGGEGAGTVVAVGPGVTDVAVGDRVAAAQGFGAYAEERNMPADRLVKLPDAVDDRTAAAMMLKGMTAQYLLRQTFRVRPEHTILFHAAAGGVGLIAGQWAKHLGCTVIGTVGSEDKAELARENGYTHVINYRTENFVERVKEITGGKGCDAVYDSIGKDTFMQSLDCLKRRGMAVLFGQSSGPVPPLDLNILNQKGSLYVTRPTLFAYSATRPELLATAGELLDLVAKGVIRIQINQEFPLAAAADAHRALESRATTGATVLIP
jgi:NADPH2:quinone reductase